MLTAQKQNGTSEAMQMYRYAYLAKSLWALTVPFHGGGVKGQLCVGWPR